MASINAENVAKEVIMKVRKGERVNFQELQKKNGYSDNSAKSMKVKETQSYQAIIKPLADRLKEEIDRIQNAMGIKDLDKEKYDVLVNALDKVNKNYQLVTGGATDNQVININVDGALANRYEINTSSNSNRD